MLKFQSELPKKLVLFFTLLIVSLGDNRVAYPQTNRVQFSSSVGVRCDFLRPVSGILGISLDDKSLDSTLSGGSAGTVQLICNKGGKMVVKVDKPTAITTDASNITPTLTSYFSTVLIQGRNGNSTTLNLNSPDDSVSSIDLNNLAPGQYRNDDITVNMGITNSSAIPSGDYGFTVRLTLITN